MKFPFLFVLASALFQCAFPSAPELRKCAWKSSINGESVPNSSRSDDVEELDMEKDDTGEKVSEEGHVVCAKNVNNCFTVWQEDPINNSSIVMGQGCWETSGTADECDRSKCITTKKPSKAMNTTKFCCCSEDMCNMDYVDAYVPTSDSPQDQRPSTEQLEQGQTNKEIMVIVLVSLGGVVLAAALIAGLYFAWRSGRRNPNNKMSPDSTHLMSGYSASIYSVDHLKMVSVVGQGKYGTVWKGTINDQDVAVKIFPAHHRNYFYNERDIYCLPSMDCPALLTYYGCDERVTMGHTEYLLILSYAPLGCLQDYLRDNTVTFPTFCKMALSVAKGLAHLHTDIAKGDEVKPCVSHRDLNSRNILVKSDLSCCLCDLGFAMKISGSKYYHNGEEQHAETKSINEVGTLRYMAPEVLEGAVNLRDCETSLKQIDVYSLGLVLWELATRCSDFYQFTNGELPEYKLPFEAEIGLHPSLEQMQALVSRHKARPLFPVHWKDSAATRLVRDTAEDCWDQDAEARLTALCVEERLHELPSLRDRHRTTVYSTSPTFNPSQSNPNINNNNLNSSVLPIYHHNPVEFVRTHSETENTVSTSQPSIGKDAVYDVSEGTVETLLTVSPSEAEPVYKNSNQTVPYIPNGYAPAYKPAPLQPYQGRNPCLERNLMSQSDSTDNLVYGSNLIDKSFKHSSHYHTNSNTTEFQGLIQHDYLSQNGGNGLNSIVNNRPATPIPYVQNDTHGGNMPKQHNTSCNGEVHSSRPLSSSRFKWNGLRRLLDRKLFGRERIDCADVEESKSNLISENGLVKKCDVVDTQVDLISGKVVNGFSNGVITSVLQEYNSCKRPSTLPLTAVKASEETEKTKTLTRSESNPINNHKLSVSSNEKNQRLQTSDSTSGISQIIKKRKNSEKSNDTNLDRQQSLEQFSEVFSSTCDLSRLKDPSQRIKTPGDVPPSVRRNRGKAASVARFSLYDDRIMSNPFEGHWSSVPDDIDITVETYSPAETLRPKEVDSLKNGDNSGHSISSF